MVFGQLAVSFHMLHNVLFNDGFHRLVCNAISATLCLERTVMGSYPGLTRHIQYSVDSNDRDYSVHLCI